MDEAFFFDPMAFGVRVRQLRQERALSLLALANDAGISQCALWKIETGTTQNPSLLLILRLADALGRTPPQLLEWDIAP